MRSLAILVAGALLLSGCAMGSAEGGVANYDALKKARDDCAAKGGNLVLKSGDSTWIGNYACERK